MSFSSSKKPAIDERTVAKFNSTATGISGTALNLNQTLAIIETDLKKDIADLKGYESSLKSVLDKKKELQKRIDANKLWIANFEKNDGSGAQEQQYRELLSQIQIIYGSAKELHGKGIDLLIKDFDYHLSYKRWNDTFTAIPFKPK